MKTIFNNLSFLLIISLGLQSFKFATEDKKELIIGVQTWSFRTMEDQSPLAILEYIKQAGIKHVELMGNHAESYAGAPESPISNPKIMPVLYKKYKQEELTEEEEAIVSQFEIDQKAYEVELAAWHETVDYSKFKELRDLYAEAGITIFAFKPRVFEKESTDQAIRYGMRAAKALGASHVTLEHPEDDKHTARLAKIAEEENMLIGYHGHEQQTPTLWDTAMAQSSANLMNLDFGHYIAGENENVIEFIEEKHDKIISMHLKDRQRKSNGGGNLMWGKGDTPIKEVVQIIYDNNYKFPVTIEVEYEIPEGSSPVDEVKRCKRYIQNILKN
jgi:sugar phosphate isomerase/epimerase